MLRWLTGTMLCLLVGAAACAGSLGKADLERMFAPGLSVGERNADLPVWPLFSLEGGQPQLRGYVFESIDFEPVRGYAGKPINLLVAIDPAGKFLQVRLLRHNEPLFMQAAGYAVLGAFARQYEGLSVNHRIEIYGARARTRRDETSAQLHGVAAGTVTVRAMDASIMESALSVAQAQIDASRAGPGSPARGTATGGAKAARRVERTSPMGWQELLDRGAVQTMALTRGQLEAAFANTRAAGKDTRAATDPGEIALEFHTALVGIPQIGRNLLGDAGWRQVSANLRRANQALLVVESGPLVRMAYESQRAEDPLPFVLRQGGSELKLRAMAYDQEIASMPASSQPRRAHVLLVDNATPLDLSQPFDLRFRIGRRFGSVASQVASSEFPLAYPVDAARWMSASYEAPWRGHWRQRAWEIGVLCLGLAVLAVALARQQWLSATPARLQAFRIGYLIFTLGFIGWYAQGQLTIVNLSASLEALLSGNDLSFLMSDPMTVVLWAFVAVALVVWGRGTFCGWLCPFGALQELISVVTRRLGLRPRRLRTALDARLKWIKYGVLGAIVLGVLAGAPFVTALVEVEPFKTAISAYFVRDWPYVAWAVGCLLLSTLVYRGYCRYICPLGAALAATGLLRRWQWIPRRQECGTPCQSCRHKCAYQAIRPTGDIVYEECFQCLDCVSIHQDTQRCLPLVRGARSDRAFIPIAVEPAA